MKTLASVFLVIALIGITACHRDAAIPPLGNLVKNYSFERNGKSSFDGWVGSGYTFVSDVPSDGGQWALQLVPEWFPAEGYAETYITGLSGSHIFKLSCDTKVTNSWTGSLSLRIKSQSGTNDIASTTFTNANWTIQVLNTNSIMLQPTDTLVVHLSSGSTEVASGQVLFDNVYLQEE